MMTEKEAAEVAGSMPRQPLVSSGGVLPGPI